MEEEEKKSVPISFSPAWSLICRLWFKIRIKSPRGPEPTCSPYPFVQKVTKDNRKRLEPAVPRGPNLPSSFCFFCSSLPFFLFFTPSYFFCTPLSSPISSSLWLLFPPFLPVNLCLPATPHCKGRPLCSADGKTTFKQRGSRCGTATTNRIFCGRSEETLSSRGEDTERGWERDGGAERLQSDLFVEVPFFQEGKLGACLTEDRLKLRWVLSQFHWGLFV